MDHAKYLANKGTLLLVLVSSEGHIVPLIDSTSSSSRKASLVEILDLNSTLSEHYLTQRGVSDSLAKRVFNLTGGQFMYLIKAVELSKKHCASGLSEEDVLEQIKRSLLIPLFL